MEIEITNPEVLEFGNCYPIYSQEYCSKKVIILYPLLYLFTGIILGFFGTKHIVAYFKTHMTNFRNSALIFTTSTVFCFVVFTECYVEWTDLTYYQYLFFSLMSQMSFYVVINQFTLIMTSFQMPFEKFFKIIQYIIGFVIVSCGLISLVYYLFGNLIGVKQEFTTFMTNLYYGIKIFMISLYLIVAVYTFVFRKEMSLVFTRKEKLVINIFIFSVVLVMAYLLVYFTTIYGKNGYAQIYTFLNLRKRGTRFIVYSMVSDYLFDIFSIIVIVISISLSADASKEQSDSDIDFEHPSALMADLIIPM